MLWHCVIVLCGGGIFAIALWLASKNGSKSAQLEALRAELKKQAQEQERAQRITDSVYAFGNDDVRKRLYAIANKQR